MNTPAHVLLNVTLLAHGGRRERWRSVLLGGLIPDTAMFLFFVWATFIADMPQRQIWDEAYFRDEWQDFFDIFNSLPLAALGLTVAWRLKQPAIGLFFASMLLHFALDLPLHHDDGHRHLFPLSDWRFASPVSYWDPRHYGRIVGGLEAIAAGACGVVLWHRFPTRAARVAVVLAVALYLPVVAAGLYFAVTS